MNAAIGLDGLLEPLSLCLDAESARRLVAFQIDPQVLARIEALGERANEGQLTADERQCARFDVAPRYAPGEAGSTRNNLLPCAGH